MRLYILMHIKKKPGRFERSKKYQLNGNVSKTEDFCSSYLESD